MLNQLGQNEKAGRRAGQARLAEKALLTKSWNQEKGLFFDISDSKSYSGELKTATISSLIPLMLDGLAKDKAKILVREHLENPDEFALPFPVPSVARGEKTFNPRNSLVLWRGPTWINSNWMVIKGLIKQGYYRQAKELAEKTIGLVEKSGFWEFYNPLTGQGGGQKNLSWSALIVDIAEIIGEL
jgi:glycogen debranching enzyme